MTKFYQSFIFISSLLFIASCSTESTPVYQLNTSVEPSEAGTVAQSEADAEEGDSIEITANANEHWVFDRWSGDYSGTDNPANVTMDADKSVTALFEKREYPLTIDIEGEGTVDERVIQQKTTDYPHGTVVELTANPAGGWEFVEWSGDIESEEEVIEVNIDGDTNITVTFERLDYPLTITIEGEGEVEQEIISSPKTTEYPFETVVELTANPMEGWEFIEWTGDINSVENPYIIDIIGDKNLTARFATTPTINTLAVESITFTSAVIGGEVEDNGGDRIIETGFCWSKFEVPDFNDTCIITDIENESFDSTISDLELGINYYVRAFATNSIGTAFGNEKSFTTKDEIEDIDGNTYKVVKVANQFWMAENLRTTKYSDGSEIPNIEDDWLWERAGYGAWSYYNNDSSYNTIYGKLYNHIITHESRSVCPDGWRIPYNEDWLELINKLGGRDKAGGKMKKVESDYWKEPNIGATNSSNFSAVGGGFRKSDGGDSIWIKEYGIYASYISGIGPEATGAIRLNHREEQVDTGLLFVGGVSIRCLKN